jgi:hypothetical protein
VFLTGGEAVLAMRHAGALRMKLLGASPADLSGVDEMAAKTNYFTGNDPKKWHANVPTYAKVKYRSVYPGIDLIYYGNQRQLEYDFVVAPGADPRRIWLDLRGARSLARDGAGDLVLAMGDGDMRWHKPVAYQEKNGVRQEVAAGYVVSGGNRVGFELGAYDRTQPLFIDPLIYSTYLGGSGYDEGLGITVDSARNAYIVGVTQSTDFPTVNPVQPTFGGDSDVFVAKFNSTGSAITFSTYLGGSSYDTGAGIAVDRAGNVYVTGYTTSNDFPTVNALQPVRARGGNQGYDAFVAKLDPTGSALIYSTYLGETGTT